MIVSPEIAALRDDETPLARDRAVMAEASAYWCESEAAVLDTLAAFDTGAALTDLPALAELFTGNGRAAAAFAARFTAAQAEAQLRAPLAHVAHRHFTDGINATLLLGRRGGTTLTLVAIDGVALARQPAPVAATFPPIECWDRVLAGSADAETIACTPDGPHSARLEATTRTVAAGALVARDARTTALLWRRVHGSLVLLSLQRRARVSSPVSEYRLADGRLIHCAAGNPRESRQEMMVSMLGAMGRADAAPLLAEIAREPGADAVRWQALREGLGLDTRTGFLALDAVARNLSDPLAEPAADLRAHLTEAYPQLRDLA